MRKRNEMRSGEIYWNRKKCRIDVREDRLEFCSFPE